MKSPGLRACLLAVGIVFIILNAGCEQEQVPSEKKARLIAVENMDLKQQLQQRDIEIEKLTQKHERELKKQERELDGQKKLLAECQTVKEDLEQQLAGKFGEEINKMFDNVAEEAKRLLEENESLKQQIKELKGETEENETPM